MCNAWNHRPGCRCGWGGEGHAGHSSFSSFGTYNSAYTARDTHWWVPPLTSTYTSYVNPNASCPVCGAPVFFYQSPSGGRVFFDELGPPWPKHPCTDNSSRPSQPQRVSVGQPSAAPPPKTYAWQREGWQPFFIRSVIGIDKDFLKITGTLQDQSICFCIQRLVEHHLHDDSLSERSLAQLRSTSDSTYQLSILLPNGTPITVEAFVRLAEAREALVQRLNAQKKPTAAGHTSDPRSPRERDDHGGIRHSGPIRSPLDTTMAQAFKKAQARRGKG